MPLHKHKVNAAWRFPCSALEGPQMVRDAGQQQALQPGLLMAALTWC